MPFVCLLCNETQSLQSLTDLWRPDLKMCLFNQPNENAVSHLSQLIPLERKNQKNTFCSPLMVTVQLYNCTLYTVVLNVDGAE